MSSTGATHSRNFLMRPFPFGDSGRASFIRNLLIGVFVALFLIIFQPFGLWSWVHPQKNFFIAGYGLITFLILSLESLLMPRLVNEDKWTIGKEILMVTATICLIALGNALYSAWIGIFPLTTGVVLNFLLITFSVAIFPVAFITFLVYYRLAARHRLRAEAANVQLEGHKQHTEAITEAEAPITYTAENGKDTLTLQLSGLLYIQSADNYCMLMSLENGQVKRQMLRSSLKRLEEQHPQQPLCRCHRGYIVNLQHVQHVEGNAQGYRLRLAGCDEEVPVSRSYSRAVLEQLEALK